MLSHHMSRSVYCTCTCTFQKLVKDEEWWQEFLQGWANYHLYVKRPNSLMINAEQDSNIVLRLKFYELYKM